MTGPVDVLAVIRHHEWNLRKACGSFDNELKRAHAAVAELIEAADRLQRKAIVQAKTTSSVFTTDVESLRAALARVGGAA